jgi:cytochrome b
MARNQAAAQSDHVREVRVWDSVVRVGHSILVVAFVVAYISAEEEQSSPAILHVWAGYAIGCVVLLRVLWGFVGTRYARFSNFVYSPAKVIRYLADMLRGRARRFLGHSPAGGAMTLALLASLAATVTTGLMAYGDRSNGQLASPQPAIIMQPAQAEDEGGGNAAEATGEGGVASEIHGVLANLTLLLIIVHVVGVLVASIVHRENLAAAMINGWKRSGDH